MRFLDDLVSRVAGVDLEVILTTGYADRIGSDAYNLKLFAASCRRREGLPRPEGR